MKHEDAVRWIKRYEEGDKTYPYLAWRWYRDEAKARALTADEEKTLMWLKKTYGIDGLDGNYANKFRRG